LSNPGKNPGQNKYNQTPGESWRNFCKNKDNRMKIFHQGQMRATH